MYVRKTKLICTMVVCLLISVMASAQLSISVKNTEIKDVLAKIEQQSDYTFFYSENFLDMKKKISINEKNRSIESLLAAVFKGTDIQYRIENDKQIILSNKKYDKSATDQKKKIEIRGKIEDSKGEAIIGANVLEAGVPGNGTVTDYDGNFSLQVQPNAMLKISYIGYLEQIVQTKGTQMLHIVLQEDVKTLREVVVTALGIERDKKTLAYSSQQVDMEGLSKIKDVNVGNALAGKIAGVTISSSSVAAGVSGDPRIIIRGNRSIFGNNQPLVVVDGNPIGSSGGALAGINPDNVLSMNVLKGPTAAALYGSSAQNGAIIITTKKGQSGAPKIEINSSSSFDMPYMFPVFQNEYGQGSGGAYSANNEGNSWGPKMTGQEVTSWTGEKVKLEPQPNNVKDIYGTGYNLMNNISYSAGSEKHTVYLSYSNTTAQGILSTNKIQRHNFNMRLSAELLKNLSLDFKLNWGFTDLANSPDMGDNTFNPMMNALIMPRSIRTQDIKDGYYMDENGSRKQLTWTPKSTLVLNPHWAKYGRENPNNSNSGGILGVLKYRFTDYLTLQGRLGLSRGTNNWEQKVYWDTYYLNQGHGAYSRGNSESRSYNSDLLLTFNKNISSNFRVNASVGAEIRDSQGSWMRAETTTNGLKLENKFALSNAVGSIRTQENDWHVQKQAVYGMAQFAFKEYLFLDATWRNDWSSTLPKPHNYNYPSIGLTAILSDMFALPEAISFVKLRGIYAEVGNDASRSMIYQTYILENSGPLGWVSPKETKMPLNLIPERTKSWEAGAELRFLKNRFGVDFTYYKSNTYNQLMRVTTPSTSGYYATWINAGNIQNSGIELMLTATPVQLRDFTWDVNLNFSKNINKVVELSPTLDRYKLSTPGLAMGQSWVEKGRPYGEIYVRDFKKNDKGEYLVNEKGDPLAETNPDTYLGNFNYDWAGSISNTFNYKNWSLYFLIDLNYGGWRVSATESYLIYYGTGKNSLNGREGGILIDGVTESGQKNSIKIPAERYGQMVGGRSSNAVGKLFAHKATNSRLREFSISYAIPLKNKVINGIELSAVGRNLFFLYNGCSWFDPDATYDTGVNGQGFENAYMPGSRNLGINVKLKF